MTTTEAILAINALTNLAVQSAQAAQRISLIIQRAQVEGRDISPAEAEQIRESRRAAVDAWNAQAD